MSYNLSPYTKDDNAFQTHLIINTLLLEGFDGILGTGQTKLRKAAKLTDLSEHDYVLKVYEILGLATGTTTEQLRESAKAYLTGYIAKEKRKTLEGAELELAKEVGVDSSIIDQYNKLPERYDRDIKTLADEIAGYLYMTSIRKDLTVLLANQTSDTIVVNEEPTTLETYINDAWNKMKVDIQNKVLKDSSAYIETGTLFGKQSSYKLVAEVSDQVLGAQRTTGKKHMMFFIGDTDKKELEQLVLTRLLDMVRFNTNLYLTSSNMDIYNTVTRIFLPMFGNITNAVKTIKVARSIVSDDKQSAADKKVCINVLNAWFRILSYLRNSGRRSVYDVVSDFYLPGQEDANARRIVYGNNDTNKTISVTIKNGTFRTSANLLDSILSLKSLSIEETATGYKLMSGKTDVWAKIFTMTKPADGNWLNLLESNQIN